MSESRMKPRQDIDQPAVARPVAMAVPAHDLFSDTRMALVRNGVAKDAPEDVFVAMVEIARTRGLDPLAKQIGVIKFGGQWQVMTTIDGYRALAEKTGQYAGSDEAIFTYSGQTVGNKVVRPDSASVTVWKLLGGQRYPFTATVYWEEYAASNVWLTKPRTMLAKVAESHALRKAFPTVLSGMYVDGEMDQLAIETTGSVDQASSRPKQADGSEDDEHQRAMDALHATGNELGLDHEDIKAFVAHRKEMPVADLGSMTGWRTPFLRWCRLQVIEHGREWATDREAGAEIVAYGRDGTHRRALRLGESVDEYGLIVPAEDEADAVVFPTNPASLLTDADERPATDPDRWTN